MSRSTAKQYLEQHGYPSTEHNHEKELIDTMVEFAEQENKRLRDFKEFVNMMIRRNLNHTCSDYEALMAIDEKLTKETGNE